MGILSKLTLSVFFLLFSSYSFAATYYVATDGDAGNDGSEVHPWTMKHACATAVASDTVIVKDGTYIDDSSEAPGYSDFFDIAHSGTDISHQITFQAENRWGAIVQTHDLNPHWYAWVINGESTPKSWITIDGFKVVGGMMLFETCSHITVKNIELTYGTEKGGDASLNWGFAMHGAVTYCTFQNNYLHDMHDSGNHADNSAYIEILGGSGCYGLTCDGGEPAAVSHDNIIENNTVDGKELGFVQSGIGIKGGSTRNNIYRKNFIGNVPTGIFGQGSTADPPSERYDKGVSIYQNIVVNATFGIRFDHRVIYASAYNNVGYNLSYSLLAVSRTDCSNLSAWNNIGIGKPGVRGISWSSYPEAETFAWLFDYLDYNNMRSFTYWAVREKSPTIYYTTPALFYAGQCPSPPCSDGLEEHSITTDPSFVGVNGSFVVPSAFKRSSYTENGRGGSYEIVMGAYIDGLETIGYVPETAISVDTLIIPISVGIGGRINVNTGGTITVY